MKNSHFFHLGYLNLEKNALGDKNVKIILDSMKTFTLKILNLSVNNITDNCGEAILGLLKRVTSLRVKIFQNYIGNLPSLEQSEGTDGGKDFFLPRIKFCLFEGPGFV